MIEIQPDKVQALISEFKEDYDHLSDHLKIMNKRMVLLNPVNFDLPHFLVEIHEPTGI